MGSIPGSSTKRRPTPSTHSSPIPDIALTSHINTLLNSSIVVNTRQAHAVGINAFETFHHFQKLQNVWPPLDTHITRFIAYMSLSLQTLNSSVIHCSHQQGILYVDHFNYLTQESSFRVCKEHFLIKIHDCPLH